MIDRHTSLPFYLPFLPFSRREEIINVMKYGDSRGIYARTGMLAGSICVHKHLSYCPICVQTDKFTYGEAYFHRVHQLQGVIVCPEHACLLHNYIITRKDISRIKFIRLDERKVSSAIQYENNQRVNDLLLKVARSGKYILMHDLKAFTQDSIREQYLNLLSDKGYLTLNNRIKQRVLYEDFVYFYGEKYLNIFESGIDPDNESNWLKLLIRKPKRMVHPIRNILLILFLCDNIEAFFESSTTLNKAFGDGPWPCLNPVSTHYKQNVASCSGITADYKTRVPVGTFTCSCGFIYSRRGPDRHKEDRYKIGRIKEYGEVWEEKLKCLLLERYYGLRELGRLMECDPKTIVKYSEMLGLRDLVNSQMNLKLTEEGQGVDLSEMLMGDYRKDILEIVNANQGYTRKQIRGLLKKQYIYLYRHDRDWLEHNLPECIPRSKRNNSILNKVDWDKRDSELFEIIQAQYRELLACDKPVRITKSLISKKTDSTAILYKHIDKLPKTKEYLDQITESIEDFQIRRLDAVCKRIFEEKGKLTEWEIMRAAGLKSCCSPKVKLRIKQNISAYLREVSVNEG